MDNDYSESPGVGGAPGNLPEAPSAQDSSADGTPWKELRKVLRQVVPEIDPDGAPGTCPPRFSLTRYHRGLFQLPDMKAISHHLSRCGHCQDKYRALPVETVEASPAQESIRREHLLGLVCKWLQGVDRAASGGVSRERVQEELEPLMEGSKYPRLFLGLRKKPELLSKWPPVPTMAAALLIERAVDIGRGISFEDLVHEEPPSRSESGGERVAPFVPPDYLARSVGGLLQSAGYDVAGMPVAGMPESPGPEPVFDPRPWWTPLWELLRRTWASPAPAGAGWGWTGTSVALACVLTLGLFLGRLTRPAETPPAVVPTSPPFVLTMPATPPRPDPGRVSREPDLTGPPPLIVLAENSPGLRFSRDRDGYDSIRRLSAPGAVFLCVSFPHCAVDTLRVWWGDDPSTPPRDYSLRPEDRNAGRYSIGHAYSRPGRYQAHVTYFHTGRRLLFTNASRLDRDYVSLYIVQPTTTPERVPSAVGSPLPVPPPHFADLRKRVATHLVWHLYLSHAWDPARSTPPNFPHGALRLTVSPPGASGRSPAGALLDVKIGRDLRRASGPPEAVFSMPKPPFEPTVDVRPTATGLAVRCALVRARTIGDLEKMEFHPEVRLGPNEWGNALDRILLSGHNIACADDVPLILWHADEFNVRRAPDLMASLYKFDQASGIPTFR